MKSDAHSPHHHWRVPLAVISTAALMVASGVAAGPTAQASVTTTNSAAPDVSDESYQVADGDAQYVEPTNTFYDDVSDDAFYLLLQDKNSPVAADQITPPDTDGGNWTVTVDGQPYDVPDANVIEASDTQSAATAVGDNKTLFVDPGEYDSNSGYVFFSHTNFSLVGLGDATDDSTDNDVTMVRSFNTPPQSGVNSYRIGAQNVYFGNIIFDGNHQDMTNDTAFGQYAWVITGAGTDASKNFVMKDCTIQNVGSSSTEGSGTAKKNVALQALYGAGPHYFINLKIKDVMTTGYNVVQTNQSSDNYFYDLQIDTSAAASSSPAISIENSNTNYLPLEDNGGIFAGDSTQISPNDFIQVGDSRYDSIAAPASYRYVEYYGDGDSTAPYRIWRDIQAPSNDAWLDRDDNYWVVRQMDPTDPAYQSLTAQISSIASVRQTMAELGEPGVAASSIPPANIKIVVPDGQNIEPFDVLGFPTADPVSIVAVSGEGIPLGTVQPTGVPVAEDFGVHIGNSSDDTPAVTFYNFDFSSVAHATLTEVTTGVSPISEAADPNDGSYPDGLNLADYSPTTASSPLVLKADDSLATADQFVNCEFTGLESASADGTTEQLTIANPDQITVGQDVTVTPLGEAYTAASADNLADGATVDDPTFYYALCTPPADGEDPVVSVDSQTGEVTGLKPGNATVCVKAIDTYNAGEIEKPWGSFTVTVAQTMTASAGEGSIDVTTLPSTDGSVTIANDPATDPTATLVSTTVGDVLDADGQPADGFTLTQADPDDPSGLNRPHRHLHRRRHLHRQPRPNHHHHRHHHREFLHAEGADRDGWHGRSQDRPAQGHEWQRDDHE